MIWALSIGFVFVAPIEIYEVYVVKHSTPIEIKIKSINLDSASCGSTHPCEVISVKAINLQTNEPISELIKMEPGVFPFSIVFFNKVIWSTYRNYPEIYQADKHYTAYLTKHGEYYLSKGSYIPFVPLLVLSLLWLAGNTAIMLMRKDHAKSESGIK